MKLMPFPFKIIPNDSIRAGFYSIPSFCTRNGEHHKCRNFYKKINGKIGVHKCPYGFAIEYFNHNGIKFFLTCLNVDKISDRKEVQRNLSSKDFLPRVPYMEYLRIKDSIIDDLNSVDSILITQLNNESEKSDFQLEKELLENTIHEIRKLNNQMKSSVGKLSFSIQKINERIRTDYIESHNLDILSISNLISIRLDAYDLEVNPILNLQELKKEIPIYKKIEKIYKCLRSELSHKGLTVNMKGESYNLYEAGNIIEIAFFIILDNAIKYSPRNREIEVLFKESEDNLTVIFKNWGIRPQDEDLKNLFNRSYRSKNIQNSDIEGRGIGLYLFSQICNANNISYHVELGKKDDNYYEGGYRYSPFSIVLNFKGMIIGDKDDSNLIN